MSTPAPMQRDVPVGLHEGVPYAVYDQWPAARHSVLRLFNRTPAHAREAIEHPPEETRALIVGHAIHLAILEPERFAREYVAAPKVDRRTTIGKARWSDFQAANIGKHVLDAEEHACARRCRESVWAHPTARELLEGQGKNEVSALWADIETGQPCKARIDRLTALSGWSVIVDVKSTENAGPRAFGRDIFRYSYHQQGGFYLDGCDALAPRERKVIFVAVEKEPPCAVAVYELEQDAIDLGRDEYRKHLAEYARCIETGRWPGYPDGIGYISLPPWAFKFHGEDA